MSFDRLTACLTRIDAEYKAPELAQTSKKHSFSELNCSSLCGQHKNPHVGDMKFKRSGAASAAPLRSLSGCARGCRSEYNDQSFHWLH